MKDLKNYVLQEPEKSEFNLFFVNVVSAGELIHSGMISNRSDLDWKMDEILIEAIKKEITDKAVSVGHTFATWDFFFDTDNQIPYEKKYQPPFSGEYIRYTLSEGKKPKRNTSQEWNYLGKEWTVFVNEVENEDGYRQALADHKNRQRELLEEFKVALFKDASLEDNPKREKIWEKAVSKFGTDHPDRLAKLKEFVSDVAELA